MAKRKISKTLATRRKTGKIHPHARVNAKRGMPHRAPTHREPADEHAATELVMYIENTSDLSPDGPSGQGRSVLLNALRKWKKGTYDSTKAVRLFEYLAESGAKRYAKEYDSEKNWATMFNPATRHEAAKQLEASFRSSVENGEYDHVDTRIGVREGVEVEARRRPASAAPPVPASGFGKETSPADIRARITWEKWAADEQRRIGNNALAQAHDLTRVAYEEYLQKKTGTAREVNADRKHSMSYGELPSFEQFEEDIRRPDPDHDSHPYWPEYQRFPLELVSAREIELAERYGLPEFRAERHRTGRNTRVRGFNADEHEMYGFLEYLVEQMNDGDDEAGNLASSIMTTLGYEWI